MLGSPLNIDSFFVYSYLLMIIILKTFSNKVDMDKFKNITILSVLNITVILAPLTMLFILGKIINRPFTNDIMLISNDEISKSYLEFLLIKIKTGSFHNLFLPLFLVVCIVIVLLYIRYFIKRVFHKKIELQ